MELEDVDKRLSIHEAVCAERYGYLLSRMGRMEKIMITAVGVLITVMGTLIWKLISLVKILG